MEMIYMATYLKESEKKSEFKQESEKVSQTVQAAIKEIEAEGDAAVRRFSERFDNWSPESFRLSDEKIAEICAGISEQTKKDITFAQDNIRKFAEKQKETLKDLTVEMEPGVILGHKNIPVNSV